MPMFQGSPRVKNTEIAKELESQCEEEEGDDDRLMVLAKEEE